MAVLDIRKRGRERKRGKGSEIEVGRKGKRRGEKR